MNKKENITKIITDMKTFVINGIDVNGKKVTERLVLNKDGNSISKTKFHKIT